MKFIELTQGKVAIVDDDRYDALMKFKWRAVRHKRSWYAKTTIYKNGKQIDISMHRFIAKTRIGFVPHHHNRNSLDNRRANLENMTRKNHDRLHANNKLLVRFAPVTANRRRNSDRNYDQKQE